MVGLPQRLKELAVLCLPSCIAERMSEEWQAHLASTPGLLAQMMAAMGFVIASFHLKLAWKLRLVWKLKLTPEKILAAWLGSEQWETQNLILQLVTLPAERARERILESMFEDQHTITETVALVRRVAVEEPDHPFIRSFDKHTGRPFALREQLFKALSVIADGQTTALRDLEIKIRTSARLANDRLTASQRDAVDDALLAISQVRTSWSDENDLACATWGLVDEVEAFDRVDTAITMLKGGFPNPHTTEP